MNQCTYPDLLKSQNNELNKSSNKNGNSKSHNNVEKSKLLKKCSEDIDEINYVLEEEKIVQQQETSELQIDFLNYDTINNKIKKLRETQYPGINQQSDEIIQFIQEQFENFMNNLIGKVLQVAMLQNEGNDWKVYQNKDLTKDQKINYKQQIKLEQYYGPEKDAIVDVSLCNNEPQSQNQCNFQLAELTPTQRLPEYRKLMQNTENIKEQILINKIQQNILRKELNCQFEDILNKKINKKVDLGDIISEFLCRNIVQENQEKDKEIKVEKSDKQNIQDKAYEVDKKLQYQIHEQLKDSERYLNQIYKRQQQFKLDNLEKQNDFTSTIIVTIKVVQYVLENIPYYKKSRILYRSYIQ